MQPYLLLYTGKVNKSYGSEINPTILTFLLLEIANVFGFAYKYVFCAVFVLKTDKINHFTSLIGEIANLSPSGHAPYLAEKPSKGGVVCASDASMEFIYNSMDASQRALAALTSLSIALSFFGR